MKVSSNSEMVRAGVLFENFGDYRELILNGTATSQDEKLCRIILKSMHKCTSYGQDKLNLCDLLCDLEL